MQTGLPTDTLDDIPPPPPRGKPLAFPPLVSPPLGATVLLFLSGFLVADRVFSCMAWIVNQRVAFFSCPESTHTILSTAYLMAACALLASFLNWFVHRGRPAPFSAARYIVCLTFTLLTAAAGVLLHLLHLRTAYANPQEAYQSSGLPGEFGASGDQLNPFWWGFGAAAIACGIAAAALAAGRRGNPPAESS